MEAEWVDDDDFVVEEVDGDEEEGVGRTATTHKTRCLVIKHDSLEHKSVRVIHSRGDGLGKLNISLVTESY